ncbi:MAG: Asp-tRNA(Asn)/Glu-tRNA(Gln) amidotransferase subunit GatA [Candidatus Buchananbacteria bacterium]
MSKLNELTLVDTFQGLRNKDFSAEELTRDCLARIEKVDEQVKAYLTVTPELAISQAQAVDQKIGRGESLSPLAGIPVAIKDLFCTQGVRTTAASKILEQYVPPYDATVVKTLRSAGGVFLGKTNLDEFAMGGSTENSAYFPTHNPWDLARVPGGSSGGSAAAMAADECIYALGTDTGGSIREPASFCGTTGLKVSYGRVSRFGVLAMTSSLDTVGPFGKTAEDVALIMKYLAGHDDKDSTTPNLPVPDYSAEIIKDLKGLVMGVPKEYFIEGLDPKVKAVVEESIKKFESLGVKVQEISLPHTAYGVAAYYIICPSEVSSNLARYDGIKYGHSTALANDLLEVYLKSRAEGLGAEAKRRVMVGTYALSAGYYDAYYLQAQKVRTLVKQDFTQAFTKVDFILTPVAPTPAFKIGENIDDPIKMYLSDVFTIPASLAGICGLVVPAGLADGLPVGIQLLGDRFKEEMVLRVGHQYQQATNWHKQKPQL